jgi:hypothetical protein
MKFIVIHQSTFDREFREQVTKLLSLAKTEVIIMAGELSSYDFLDLRDAFDTVIERGIKSMVYANAPPIHTINRLVLKGVEVYIGKRMLEDHYTIVDRKHWAFSKMHPSYAAGTRALRSGGVYFNDPEGARKKARLFDEYRRDPDTRKYTSIDWKNDPILSRK